ncbi:hypothetical protein BD324DRAFT_684309, partial [Kockovaella imperatae]
MSQTKRQANPPKTSVQRVERPLLLLRLKGCGCEQCQHLETFQERLTSRDKSFDVVRNPVSHPDVDGRELWPQVRNLTGNDSRIILLTWGYSGTGKSTLIRSLLSYAKDESSAPVHIVEILGSKIYDLVKAMRLRGSQRWKPSQVTEKKKEQCVVENDSFAETVPPGRITEDFMKQIEGVREVASTMNNQASSRSCLLIFIGSNIVLGDLPGTERSEEVTDLKDPRSGRVLQT